MQFRLSVILKIENFNNKEAASMFISQTAAQAIVEEIGNEIHEHINMMDSNGIIIASTNPERIGQIHEGARKVITEKLSELYITEDMAILFDV